MTGTSHPDNDHDAVQRVTEFVAALNGLMTHLDVVNNLHGFRTIDGRSLTLTITDLRAVVAEVSRLREEVDTLRADQALDREGHQRVCVPIETERDALRQRVAELEAALLAIRALMSDR